MAAMAVADNDEDTVELYLASWCTRHSTLDAVSNPKHSYADKPVRSIFLFVVSLAAAVAAAVDNDEDTVGDLGCVVVGLDDRLGSDKEGLLSLVQVRLKSLQRLVELDCCFFDLLRSKAFAVVDDMIEKRIS